MSNFVLNLMFDGTAYHGWQIQDNALTVCEVVQDAVKKITGQRSEIIGCSRTDAGVHALSYICNFKSDTKIPADKLSFALNTKLPSDIRVQQSYLADDDFHARFSAKSKTYVYKSYYSVAENPFLRNYAYRFGYETDIDKMKRAAEHIVGTHDFSAFRTMGSSQKTTVRTVNFLNVTRNDGVTEFEINADGYLYNMVRIISGTLLYCGCGRIDPDEIPDIIKSGDRTRAGITAVPQGLFLKKIYY